MAEQKFSVKPVIKVEGAARPELDALLATTERYCTVYQTLSRPPELSMQRAEVAPGRS